MLASQLSVPVRLGSPAGVCLDQHAGRDDQNGGRMGIAVTEQDAGPTSSGRRLVPPTVLDVDGRGKMSEGQRRHHERSIERRIRALTQPPLRLCVLPEHEGGGTSPEARRRVSMADADGGRRRTWPRLPSRSV